MNDLENLRKRAKSIVRAHAAGQTTLADRIRRTLPRFAGMTDREVLESPFALHDAQHLIALELGFTDWTELKETGMPDKEDPERFTVWRAYAQVFVRDVTKSIDFYTNVLGFDLDWAYGEPPFYAQLARGGCVFNLRHTDTSPWVAKEEDDDLLSVRLEVDDAKALFLEYRDKGAEFHQTLRSEPWDQTTFIVRDPDGNLILFGSR